MAAGPEIATLATVLLIAVQQRSFSARLFSALRSAPILYYATATLIMATGSTSNKALLAAIQGLEDRMNERMTSMKKELTQEREQADERLVKRMKLEKAPTFKKKSHEVQYTFNEEVKSKLDSVKAALQETPPAVEKAKTAVEEGEKLINERQKLIRIADRSEHGWATVEEYEEDELAEDSDDEKKLFKAEARAGRKLRQKLAKGKGKKAFRKPGQGNWWNPYRWQPNASVPTVGVDVPRQAPSASTSSTPSQGTSQPSLSQLGPCFLCGNMGHFKKSCPLWAQLRAQPGKNAS